MDIFWPQCLERLYYLTHAKQKRTNKYKILMTAYVVNVCIFFCSKIYLLNIFWWFTKCYFLANTHRHTLYVLYYSIFIYFVNFFWETREGNNL